MAFSIKNRFLDSTFGCARNDAYNVFNGALANINRFRCDCPENFSLINVISFRATKRRDVENQKCQKQGYSLKESKPLKY